jgi:hypothetical protein
MIFAIIFADFAAISQLSHCRHDAAYYAAIYFSPFLSFSAAVFPRHFAAASFRHFDCRFMLFADFLRRRRRMSATG